MLRMDSYPVYYYQNQFNSRKGDKELSQQKEIIRGQMARIAESDTLSDAEKTQRLEKFGKILSTIDEKIETGTVKNPYTSERVHVDKRDIPVALGLRGDYGYKKGKPLLRLLQGVRSDFLSQVEFLDVHKRDISNEERIDRLLEQAAAEFGQAESSESLKDGGSNILRADTAEKILSYSDMDKDGNDKKARGRKRPTPRMTQKLSTYNYFDVRNVERILPNVRNPKIKYRMLDLLL